jgi:hypothetical protein
MIVYGVKQVTRPQGSMIVLAYVMFSNAVLVSYVY